MNDSLYDPFSIPQLVGYIATLFGIIGFLQKDDHRLRVLISIMTVFLIMHFLLMGSYTASLSSAFASSRWWLSIFEKARKHAHILVPVYVLIFITIGILTYERWYDVLPPMASILGTIGLFYMHGFKLRLFLLAGCVCWLVHNIVALSYGPAIMEAFIFAANTMVIVRLVLEHKKLSKELKDNSFSRFG